MRVGDVGVDALGRDVVPLAPLVEQQPQRRAQQRPAGAQRRLALGPGVAERVVAVADVHRAGVDQHAVRPRARGGDDDVVAAQVERLDRVRVERQQRAERARGRPQPLQERRLRLAVLEAPLGALGVVDGREDVRVRPRVADRREDALRAAEVEQEVVDECDTGAHRCASVDAPARGRLLGDRNPAAACLLEDSSRCASSPSPALIALALAVLPATAAAERSVPRGWLGVIADGPLTVGRGDGRRVGPDGLQRRRGRADRLLLAERAARRRRAAGLRAPRRRRAAGRAPRAARAADRDRHADLGGQPRRRRDLSPARSRALRGLPARARGAATGPQGSLWAEHPEVAARPIRAWQIWNEPNLTRYWTPPQRPGLRPRLREAAARRRPRAARPPTPARARSSPGCRTRAGSRCGRSTRPAARGSFDAVALHPYTGKPRNVVRLAELRPQGDAPLPRRPQAALDHGALVAGREGQDEEHHRLRDHRPRPGAAARRGPAAARPRPQAPADRAGVLVHVALARGLAELVRLLRPAPRPRRPRDLRAGARRLPQGRAAPPGLRQGAGDATRCR